MKPPDLIGASYLQSGRQDNNAFAFIRYSNSPKRIKKGTETRVNNGISIFHESNYVIADTAFGSPVPCHKHLPGHMCI